MNGANGMSDIQGKVTRVGASEYGEANEFQLGCIESEHSFASSFVNVREAQGR